MGQSSARRGKSKAKRPHMLVRLRLLLTVLFAIITGSIFCVMAFGALSISEKGLEQNSQDALKSHVNTIVYRLQNDRTLDWAWLAQTEAGERLIIYIQDNGQDILYPGSWTPLSSRGELIGQARQIALEEYQFDIDSEPASQINATNVMFTLYGVQGERYQAAAILIPTPPGYKSVILLRDMRQADAQIAQQRYFFASLIIGALLLLTFFSWWFAGRSIRPIEQSQRRQAEFIASASHELRSPLAVIRASISALRYEATPEGLAFVDAVERECLRCAQLVDDLLLLANADANHLSIHLAPVDIGTILIEVQENFLPLAREKDIAISLDLPENWLPEIYGDALRLTQALTILMDNALRYAPKGSDVTLRARKRAQRLLLQVIDHGPGIPDESKTKVFDRFFRMDAARTSKTNYGLGLSIAREIVRLHQGKIQLQDTPGGGLSVFISMPFHHQRAT